MFGYLLALASSFLLIAAIGLLIVAIRHRNGEPRPKGPFISTDSPCPACGNLGCELNYDAASRKVLRKCRTCGCVVRQPVVAQSLFEEQK